MPSFEQLEALRREVNAIKWWHAIDLGHGIVTPGPDPTPGRLPEMQIPEDLTGLSVLDIGAGIGLWKHWVEKNAKGVQYTGTEVSQAMCKKHGFQFRDIARWRDRKKHDLIVCQGVLQYLPDPDVAPAVANIAAMARGLVYFEVTTRTDLRERCDKVRTDSDIYVRNGSYYRGIFAKHLVSVGCGLWWAKDRPPPFFELEMAGN